MKRLPIEHMERNRNVLLGDGRNVGACMVGSTGWKRVKYSLIHMFKSSILRQASSNSGALKRVDWMSFLCSSALVRSSGSREIARLSPPECATAGESGSV